VRRIVESAQQGNEQATEIIWLQARSIARFLAGKLVENEQDAEELASMALDRVPKVIKNFDGELSSFGAYLFSNIQWEIGDQTRVFRAQHGLSRNDYNRLVAALESDDPNQALHELTQRSEEGSTVSRPRNTALVMAPHLVVDGKVQPVPVAFEAMQAYWENINDGETIIVEPAADVNVQNEALTNIEIENAKEAIKKLPYKQQVVLTNYLGLFGETESTFKQVGTMLGITESGASQLYARAVKSLQLALQSESVDGNLKPRANNRLAAATAKLSKASNISKAQAKLKTRLEVLRDEGLADHEIATLADSLGWEYKTATLKDREYKILTRDLPQLDDATYAKIEKTGSLDRRVGVQESRLAIILKEFTGNDGLNLIDINCFIAEGTNFSYNEELISKLSPRQREVTESLYKTYGQIALELHMGVSTVRTHAHKAMKALGMGTVEELALVAARNGLIDMDNVPQGKTLSLTKRQRETVVKAYNLTYEETADLLGISISTIRTHLHNIYAALGVNNRVQAVLLALKDGLL
jgi:RNA polymerase sigma factor (sigma-70 family)